MKTYLLLLFSFLLSATGYNVQAQTESAFAITGVTQGDVNWSVIREINLSTGALIRNIYLPATQSPVQIDASTGKAMTYDPLAADTKQGVIPCTCQSPMLAAASAYDATHKRFYFTTLFGNDLQFINTTKKDLKVYHITSQGLKSFPAIPGEASNITRMVFSSDGNGYAITNDGNHVIRFTTTKKIRITDLGALTDKANNFVSVHAKPESWGGDLVADDGGFLYLFTVAAHVFKINTATLEAEYLGTIKNLPTGFNINAAAVNQQGNVTVASSTVTDDYYTVNMKSLIARGIKSPDKVYNSSDFANGNFLASDKNTESKIAPLPALKASEVVSVYPNPVKDKQVTVYFNGTLQGKHMLEVVDASGRRIASKTVDLSSESQSQMVLLPSTTLQGIYMIHVLNADNKNVFVSKLVVQ